MKRKIINLSGVSSSRNNKKNDDDLGPPDPKRVKFTTDIKSISDLIKISFYRKKYTNLDIEKIKKIRKELYDLDSLIGLKDIKNSILDQLLYYIQDLHLNSDDYLHTIITGPSGSGKTTISKILGQMFSKLGVLSSQKFITARPDTLIGEYVGQTAVKTQDILKSAKGGVLFIDEVYSMGNSEKKGNFAKESIDTINLFLSEEKHDFMLIVAGYEKEVDDCFFSYNEGLKRRFMWHHNIGEYNSDDMAEMFKIKVSECKWSLDKIEDKWLTGFFNNNKNKFKYNGGDIANFFTLCKITHAKRSLLIDIEMRKKLNTEDIENALKKFKQNEKNNIKELPPGMYI